ncbi:hypothetical protein GCM10011408_05660 [Dyella caseinilytica]|nr:hypothetical protein GCM10011408_05660 [Dyella caseinilytica]
MVKSCLIVAGAISLISGCHYSQAYSEGQGNAVSVTAVNDNSWRAYIVGDGVINIGGHQVEKMGHTVTLNGKVVASDASGKRVDATYSDSVLTLNIGQKAYTFHF